MVGQDSSCPVRVVTWNMGCGPRSRYRRSHGEAWEYLVDELRPDVTIVQEALLGRVDEARSRFAVILCEPPLGTEACTAILVCGLPTQAAAIAPVSAQTYVACVELRTPAGPLIVVGVHVYPGARQHSDLARLNELVSRSFGHTPVLVGGDFNAARRFDEVYGGRKHRTFFDGMVSMGLCDVHFGIHGREVQSFWGHQTREKYQDDHFFLTEAWVPRVRSCFVVDNEDVRRLSDHGPLVLELDVSPTEPSLLEG